MKVISLTTEQATRITTLRNAAKSAAQAAGAANKAVSDYLASLVGGPLGPLTRAEVSEDGKSLVVG